MNNVIQALARLSAATYDNDPERDFTGANVVEDLKVLLNEVERLTNQLVHAQKCVSIVKILAATPPAGWLSKPDLHKALREIVATSLTDD